MEEVRRSARRAGMSVSEWVRRAIRRARRQETDPKVARQLAAIKKALTYNFPTSDMDQIKAEIIRGYLED